MQTNEIRKLMKFEMKISWQAIFYTVKKSKNKTVCWKNLTKIDLILCLNTVSLEFCLTSGHWDYEIIIYNKLYRLQTKKMEVFGRGSSAEIEILEKSKWK